MNKKKKLFWENKYIQQIRFANRSGSHKNCFRYFKNNTDEHEDTKYKIYKKLIKNGFSVWTECIFTTGQRADIMACKGKEAYIIEVETTKSKKEMENKLKQKFKYPPDFDLIVVNTKDFNINNWEL